MRLPEERMLALRQLGEPPVLQDTRREKGLYSQNSRDKTVTCAREQNGRERIDTCVSHNVNGPVVWVFERVGSPPT